MSEDGDTIEDVEAEKAALLDRIQTLWRQNPDQALTLCAQSMFLIVSGSSKQKLSISCNLGIIQIDTSQQAREKIARDHEQQIQKLAPSNRVH